MHRIILKNSKSFLCDEETTIFEAAKFNGIVLDHSCLKSRCRSCIVKVISGKTINTHQEHVLNEEERRQKFVLACNAKPLSDLSLDLEDFEGLKIYPKRIVPSKISSIEKLTANVVKVVLRLPENSGFKYNSGQYVNIIKGNAIRSYSIANAAGKNNSQLEFFVRRYENGIMSEYFFDEANVNDLLRIEGPIGTFFLRPSNVKNVIFLATGTGIAPIKAILEDLSNLNEEFENKIYWVIVGARGEEDFIWEPEFENMNIKYFPVVSRDGQNSISSKFYVQDKVLELKIDLRDAQVYACGSVEMIRSARQLFVNHNLREDHFFSDAFVKSN